MHSPITQIECWSWKTREKTREMICQKQLLKVDSQNEKHSLTCHLLNSRESKLEVLYNSQPYVA